MRWWDWLMMQGLRKDLNDIVLVNTMRTNIECN